MYRPEGIDIEGAIRKRHCIPDEAHISEAYLEIGEAGADAMLEGLKKDKLGIPDGNGGYYRLTHWLKPEKAKFETAFIPEEE